MVKDNYKSKESPELNQLKSALCDIDEQLSLFLKEEKLYDENSDTAYCPDDDYPTQLNLIRWGASQDIRSMTEREPNITLVFFLRTIIEVLSMGSLTEREIKASMLETCKELGIKSTGRGTISGLNIDVSAMCGILSGLGIIETDASHAGETTGVDVGLRECRAAFLRDIHMPQGSKNNIDNSAEENLSVDIETSNCHEQSELIETVEDTDGSPANFKKRYLAEPLVEVELKHFKGQFGVELFSELTTRYSSRLAAYFEETKIGHHNAINVAALKQQQELLLRNQNDVNAQPGQIFDGAESLSEFASSSSSYDSGNHGSILNVFRPSASTAEKGADFIGEQIVTEILAPASATDGVRSESLESSDHFVTVGSQHVISPSSMMASLLASESSSLLPFGSTGNREDLAASIAIDVNNHASSSSSAGAAASRLGKRGPTQRIWKISTDSALIASLMSPNPAALLEAWSVACFTEQAALEVEEVLLRRIAGQCGIPMSPVPYRSGTSYLLPSEDKTMPDSEPVLGTFSSHEDAKIGSQSCSVGRKKKAHASVGSPLPAFKDGFQFTAQTLWNKARTLRARSRRAQGYEPDNLGTFEARNANSHVPFDYWTFGYPSEHIFSIGNLAIAASTAHSAAHSKPGPKRSSFPLTTVSGGAGAAVSTASVSIAMALKRCVAPLELNDNSVPIESVSSVGGVPAEPGAQQLRRSSFGSSSCLLPLHSSGPLYVRPPGSHTAVLPDLVVLSTEIPWTLIASEFEIIEPPDEFETAIVHCGSAAFGGHHSARSIGSQSSNHELASAGFAVGFKRSRSVDATSSSSFSNGSIHNKNRRVVSESSFSHRDGSLSENFPSAVTSSHDEKEGGETQPHPSAPASVFEVLAPKFTELEQITGTSHTSWGTKPTTGVNEVSDRMYGKPDDDEEEEEDLSDAAVAARHESVLKAMRDKWALMNQLKQDMKIEAFVAAGGKVDNGVPISTVSHPFITGPGRIKKKRKSNIPPPPPKVFVVKEGIGVSAPLREPRKRGRPGKIRPPPPSSSLSPGISGDPLIAGPAVGNRSGLPAMHEVVARSCDGYTVGASVRPNATTSARLANMAMNTSCSTNVVETGAVHVIEQAPHIPPVSDSVAMPSLRVSPRGTNASATVANGAVISDCKAGTSDASMQVASSEIRSAGYSLRSP